jgi:flagellar basal-body rod protein FlgF
MDITTAITLSQLTAQSRALDVTAANIANADTPGYKAERIQFTDFLSRQPGTDVPPGGADLAFMQDRATWRDWQAGTMPQTGASLDLAIGGKGWFTVQTPQGPRLTRAGHFAMGPDGTIQDIGGSALLDAQGQVMQIPPGTARITVAGDGTLSTEQGSLGRIGVVVPAEVARLRAEGARLFDASATATSSVTIPRVV